jgi:hypothetical protein
MSTPSPPMIPSQCDHARAGAGVDHADHIAAELGAPPAPACAGRLLVRRREGTQITGRCFRTPKTASRKVGIAAAVPNGGAMRHEIVKATGSNTYRPFSRDA